MKKFFIKSISVSVFFFFSVVFANQDSLTVGIFKSDEDFNYTDYYQIKEKSDISKLNLLVFEHYKSKFPLPTVPYKRDFHFGGWLRDSAADSCLDTRGKVLIRDSASNVAYTPSGCTVASGKWRDPYTANVYFSAKDIQIDHIVALKNAYMSGAYAWDFNKRCLYANYRGNDFHLLSVNGDENRKKSDHTPSGYVPPNRAYVCEFIREWLSVKLIWSLRITPKEALAIRKITKENSCGQQSFTVSASDLKAQRNYISDQANLCSSVSASLEKF